MRKRRIRERKERSDRTEDSCVRSFLLYDLIYFICITDKMTKTDQNAVSLSGGDTVVYHRIREFRERKGLTQKQLAHLLGITEQAYSDYERGTCEISASMFALLAGFYDTSIDYLVGLTDEKTPYPKAKGRK